MHGTRIRLFGTLSRLTLRSPIILLALYTAIAYSSLRHRFDLVAHKDFDDQICFLVAIAGSILVFSYGIALASK